MIGFLYNFCYAPLALTMALILVVDDDADVRELLELSLAGQGYTVDSVGSGQVALERLGQQTFDLVVCDLKMAGVDGRAIYGAIQQQPPPRPIIVFVTGYSDAGPYADWLRSTGVPVVRKPFEIDALRATVRQVLGAS